MASSTANLTMSQLRDMILAAAWDAVAAGTWLGPESSPLGWGPDVRSFASLDALEACRHGRRDDTALQCCNEDWEVFTVSLAQLHALSLRTCEVLLQRSCTGGFDAGRLLHPPDSFTAVSEAAHLLRFGLVRPSGAGALPSEDMPACSSVRRAVVVKALLAADTMRQLARVLAAALQLMLQACKQHQHLSSEQPCGPSAGHCASGPQAPPSAQPQPPLPHPFGLGVTCSQLLAVSVGVIQMVRDCGGPDVRDPLPAAFAALSDSQLLEHTAAMALAIHNVVTQSSGGDETTRSSSTSDREAVLKSFPKIVARIACALFDLMTHSRPAAAASARHGNGAAAGSSIAGGCSTSASGDGSSSAALPALGAGCHRNSKHDGRQRPLQPGFPAAASTAGTAGTARASCRGVHIWTQPQLPAATAIGGSARLAAGHFLGGPMLHTLLAMQLRLALPALEAAGGAAAPVAGRAADRLLEAMADVLSVCQASMHAVPHSSATTSTASAGGGAQPLPGTLGTRQLLDSSGGIPACSPGQVAALAARVVIACASTLDNCDTLSLHPHPVFRVYEVCARLLEVGRVPSPLCICGLQTVWL